MTHIKKFLSTYKNLISYVFFGVCTTIVNVVTYYCCFNIVAMNNVTATVIAWILAVLFAYVTNKLWVFESRSFDKDVLIKEIPAFFGCRLATGILDVGIMYVAVDVANANGTVWKIVSNVLVIIINYVASKLVIFKKK